MTAALEVVAPSQLTVALVALHGLASCSYETSLVE